MSNIESYFGVKKILIPEPHIYSGNLLSQCIGKVSEARFLTTIKSFEDVPMVGIYRISDDNPSKILNETLEGFYFVSGHLTTIFAKQELPKKQILIGDTMLYLNQLIDLIPENHLKQEWEKIMGLNMYNFTVSDDKTDLYRIAHFCAVGAFLDANYNNRDPLKLSHVSPLTPGTQFNRGKGEGKVEDLL